MPYLIIKIFITNRLSWCKNKSHKGDIMERFAQTILDAQKIREESYDIEKAKEALNEDTLVDFEQFYQITLEDACDQAVSDAGYDKRANYPIYLLNKLAWNDAHDWAAEVLKKIKRMGNKKYCEYNC